MITSPDHRAAADVRSLAEGEGFEPPDAFASLAFKASAIGRSANPPGVTIVPYRTILLATCELTAPLTAAKSLSAVGVGRGEPLEAFGQRHRGRPLQPLLGTALVEPVRGR